MRKEEFMRELEYLLQDIPDEEKADALAYYQDYLEEAGPENEEAVIRDFGSPERIAAMIRCDVNGTLEEGGAFTDQGYEDERFRDPNYQMIKGMDLPEEKEGDASGTRGAGPSQKNRQTGENFHNAGPQNENWQNGNPQNRGWQNGSQGSGYGSRRPESQPGNSKTGYGSNYGTGYSSSYGSGYGSSAGAGWNAGSAQGQADNQKAPGRKWEWWQILGLAVLICVAAPAALSAALGIGSGMVGVLALLLGILATVTIALAAAVLALILAGIVFICIGVAHMTVPLQGFLFLGTGIGILGLGILGLSLCGLYYGRFLPWLCRSIVNGISGLLHRGGKKA